MPASIKPKTQRVGQRCNWKWITALSSLLVLASGTASQARNYGSVQLLMGTPSSSPSSKNPNDFLLIKPQYALSYNSSKGTANWVSWQLNASWLGPVDRCKSFSPDPTLPAGFKKVFPADYVGSGFSRGHMTRSGDRTVTETDNCATFLLTNIVPQTQENNEGPWLGTGESIQRSWRSRAKSFTSSPGRWELAEPGCKGPKLRLAKPKLQSPLASGKWSWCWTSRGWGCGESPRKPA